LIIERTLPITFEEWIAAVEEIDEVKIIEISGDRVGKNPTTGVEIRLPGKPKRVAVFKSGNQASPFHFSKDGYIVINPIDWDNPESSLREAAFRIAEKLKAKIISDDVEIYNQ
jgi:hypothetical protein